MPNFVKPTLILLAVVVILRPSLRADEPAKSGAIVIVGGGGIPDGLRDKFMALAGGKAAKLVIIPKPSLAVVRLIAHSLFGRRIDHFGLSIVSSAAKRPSSAGPRRGARVWPGLNVGPAEARGQASGQLRLPASVVPRLFRC